MFSVGSELALAVPPLTRYKPGKWALTVPQEQLDYSSFFLLFYAAVAKAMILKLKSKSLLSKKTQANTLAKMTSRLKNDNNNKKISLKNFLKKFKSKMIFLCCFDVSLLGLIKGSS